MRAVNVLVVGTEGFCRRVGSVLNGFGIPFTALDALVEETNFNVVAESLRSIREYDWGIFTSVNAVRSISLVADRVGLRRPLDGLRRVGAVGPASAEALRAIWDGEVFVPKRYTVSALAEELPDVEGTSVIAFRSALASDELVSALLRRGARSVVQVRAYSVRVREDVELPRDHSVVLLGSPSAARAYRTLCELQGCEPRPAICIGPVTSAAAREHGLEVMAVAEEHSLDGLVRELRRVMRVA
ncbi:MAG: uroporphyrinogen-III synthase [Nitrososphaerota archaeon]